MTDNMSTGGLSGPPDFSWTFYDEAVHGIRQYISEELKRPVNLESDTGHEYDSWIYQRICANDILQRVIESPCSNVEGVIEGYVFDMMHAQQMIGPDDSFIEVLCINVDVADDMLNYLKLKGYIGCYDYVQKFC